MTSPSASGARVPSARTKSVVGSPRRPRRRARSPPRVEDRRARPAELLDEGAGAAAAVVDVDPEEAHAGWSSVKRRMSAASARQPVHHDAQTLMTSRRRSPRSRPLPLTGPGRRTAGTAGPCVRASGARAASPARTSPTATTAARAAGVVPHAASTAHPLRGLHAPVRVRIAGDPNGPGPVYNRADGASAPAQDRSRPPSASRRGSRRSGAPPADRGRQRAGVRGALAALRRRGRRRLPRDPGRPHAAEDALAIPALAAPEPRKARPGVARRPRPASPRSWPARRSGRPRSGTDPVRRRRSSASAWSCRPPTAVPGVSARAEMGAPRGERIPTTLAITLDDRPPTPATTVARARL